MKLRGWAHAIRVPVAIVAVVVLAIRAPHIAWWLRRPRTLDVVVVDKTVPFRKWREHAGFEWLLHALKIRRPDGRYNTPPLDYIGYDPVVRTGHDITDAQLRTADVLFLADTYGVYVGDYEQPGDIAALERSDRIYGGVTDAEANAIEGFANRGGLLLGEFNAFASPTEDGPRATLERTFGVRWTHWVGRYWPDLQDRREVPRWIGRVYERVYGRPFDIRGAGLVLVREDADMVVLRAGIELGPDIVTQERTGAAPEWMPPDSAWAYWFDVVEATDADVLYEHVVHATDAGGALLARHGLRTHFPALTRRRHGPRAWYFAGDFVDSGVDRGDPERAGLLWWNRTVLDARHPSLDDVFFWRWYVPVTAGILEGRVR